MCRASLDNPAELWPEFIAEGRELSAEGEGGSIVARSCGNEEIGVNRHRYRHTADRPRPQEK